MVSTEFPSTKSLVTFSPKLVTFVIIWVNMPGHEIYLCMDSFVFLDKMECCASNSSSKNTSPLHYMMMKPFTTASFQTHWKSYRSTTWPSNSINTFRRNENRWPYCNCCIKCSVKHNTRQPYAMQPKCPSTDK